MLEGTDLSSAYQHSLVGNSSSSAANSYDNSYASYFEEEERRQPQPEQKNFHQPASHQQAVVSSPQSNVQQQPQYSPQNSMYDAGVFNKQYEQEQRIVRAIAELKKKKEESSVNTVNTQPSYFDKLFSKKKEIAKILQAALIIVLGLSVYFLIDHYFKDYLINHDLSSERQLFIRLLYPLSILFILWNLRVFVK